MPIGLCVGLDRLCDLDLCLDLGRDAPEIDLCHHGVAPENDPSLEGKLSWEVRLFWEAKLSSEVKLSTYPMAVSVGVLLALLEEGAPQQAGNCIPVTQPAPTIHLKADVVAEQVGHDVAAEVGPKSVTRD